MRPCQVPAVLTVAILSLSPEALLGFSLPPAAYSLFGASLLPAAYFLIWIGFFPGGAGVKRSSCFRPRVLTISMQ